MTRPGIGVERRERHVVVVAVLEDRRVGMIAGHDRVEVGAVAEIGLALAFDAARPRGARGLAATALRRARCGHDRGHRQHSRDDAPDRRSEPAMRAHPFGPSRRPSRRSSRGRLAMPKPCCAALVEMRLDRHAGAPQRLYEHQAVLDRHAAVLGGVDQEHRRHVRADARLDATVARRSASAGAAPSRLRRESAWANGPRIVITGYSSATKSGRALMRSIAAPVRPSARRTASPPLRRHGRRPTRRRCRCDRAGRRTPPRAIERCGRRAATSCSGAGWPYSASRYFRTKTPTPQRLQRAHRPAASLAMARRA